MSVAIDMNATVLTDTGAVLAAIIKGVGTAPDPAWTQEQPRTASWPVGDDRLVSVEVNFYLGLRVSMWRRSQGGRDRAESGTVKTPQQAVDYILSKLREA